MANMFNPNELVLERIRAVEEYNTATDELIGRFTQIEDPSLKTSASGRPVVDALGVEIVKFYNAHQGTFGFSNSLFSLDMASSQFCTEKELASSTKKIEVPVSETLQVGTDGKIVLKYTPIGVSGNEVKFVKVINTNATFGTKYEVSATAGEGKFTLDTETKTITLPTTLAGSKVFVNYIRESENAVKLSKRTDGVPTTKKLVIHAIFHDPCDTNTVYAGVIVCPKAQPNIESVDISLTSEGKHAIEYTLQKSYCDEEANLFNIIVSEE